jgi:ferrous iron transport protein A
MAGRTIADLKIGEVAVIKGYEDHELTLKLLEMGFIPGSTVVINYKAPLGDPLSVRISGYNVSLRLDEAAIINVE